MNKFDAETKQLAQNAVQPPLAFYKTSQFYVTLFGGLFLGFFVYKGTITIEQAINIGNALGISAAVLQVVAAVPALAYIVASYSKGRNAIALEKQRTITQILQPQQTDAGLIQQALDTPNKEQQQRIAELENQIVKLSEEILRIKCEENK